MFVWNPNHWKCVGNLFWPLPLKIKNKNLKFEKKNENRKKVTENVEIKKITFFFWNNVE